MVIISPILAVTALIRRCSIRYWDTVLGQMLVNGLTNHLLEVGVRVHPQRLADQEQLIIQVLIQTDCPRYLGRLRWIAQSSHIIPLESHCTHIESSEE